MKRLETAIKALIRFLVIWIVDSLSVLALAFLPGITIAPEALSDRLLVAMAAAFILSIVNLLIRPVLLMLGRPLGFIAVFIFGFLANAFALLITSRLLPGFEVSGLIPAVMGSLVFAVINVILTGLLEINDEGSYYDGVIERQARKQTFTGDDTGGRGLVMLEIDGLSVHHLHKALAEGRLPTVQAMMDEEGYQISRIDCGIPSQTSACQAGIMFGDNYDIPAYRWYDKDEQKLYVSTTDAAALNARYAKGNGLMRGGSSIDNMLNGDAEKSLLTVADLKGVDAEQKRRRAEDIYLLMLNPYFLMRTIALFFGDVVRELWQGWRQRRNNVWPRLNRLAHFYPFVRAATTVLVRDISANLAIMDIIRGAPSIYVTWPGYDEVAHHSGPWTTDALGVLERYDSVIKRVRRAIQEKAPRPYDLILLSDHGQSFGPTFKQRYGVSLKGFIEAQLPQGTQVAFAIGGDTGAPSLGAMAGELQNVSEAGVGGTVGRAVAEQGQKAVEMGNAARKEEEGQDEGAAQVTAYGSGNLAQVYFDLYPRKITITELDAAYPGMVDALVQHEGIGMVCGYEDDGTPVCLGKGGKRNLHTDVVTGADPLAPYAPQDPNAYGHQSLETRAWQVRRVMDFPHAGDLMVISTIYPDGTVAALEELIGNHGGVGGEQTDAFIFHPPDMPVGETRNSTDTFHILNAQRGRPARVVPQPALTAAQVAEERQWTPGNLWAGVKDVRTWLSLALRALVLDRSAYKTVVRTPLMTGPALLLGLAGAALAAIELTTPETRLMGMAGAMLGWLVAVLFVAIAGRLLTRKNRYTPTLRAMGFARTAGILTLLDLIIPPMAPLGLLASTAVGFLGAWIGASEAFETRGWKTVVLPVVALAVMVMAPLLVIMLFQGAVLGLTSVLQQMGLAP